MLRRESEMTIDTSREAVEGLRLFALEADYMTYPDALRDMSAALVALLDRAEKAEASLARLTEVARRIDACEDAEAWETHVAFQDLRAALKAERERFRAAFRINALRWKPDLSHEEIDSELDRIALGDA